MTLLLAKSILEEVLYKPIISSFFSKVILALLLSKIFKYAELSLSSIWDSLLSLNKAIP